MVLVQQSETEEEEQELPPPPVEVDSTEDEVQETPRHPEPEPEFEPMVEAATEPEGQVIDVVAEALHQNEVFKNLTLHHC